MRSSKSHGSPSASTAADFHVQMAQPVWGAVLLVRSLDIHDYRVDRIAVKASRGSDRGMCERKTLAGDDTRRIRRGVQSLR